MATKVRDLRELVCVSRLTVRHSDDEFESSDEDVDLLTQQFSQGFKASKGLEDSSQETDGWDSGIGTANHSPQEIQQAGNGAGTLNQNKPKTADSYAMPRSFRKKKRKRPVKSNLNANAVVSTGHDFPKPTPLPPVGSSSSFSRQSSSYSSAESIQTPVPGEEPRKEGDFDELLSYLDSTVVSEWLQACNVSVADMATWCHAGENFVNFAHFWLSDFRDSQKMEIFKLEHSILVESVRFAFAVGLDSDQIGWKDVNKFLHAIFREYPDKLLSSRGPHLFLDYLHVLTSEKQEEYKTVLSNVKCSTRNRQYAQLVLAIRSFALVNMWYAVTNFYRKIATSRAEVLAQPIPIAEVNKKDPHVQRLYDAIR